MSLYGPVVADHAGNPRYFGALDRPDAAHESVNPLCGDKVRIELRLSGDRIAEARFSGEACMVSMAAASILCGLVRGLSREEARSLPQQRLLEALQTPLRPSRVGCALLPLQVLRGALPP